MLDPIDLPETVTRRRQTGTTQSPRGKLLAAGVSTQTIQCLIQPHRGNLKYEVEGVLQDVTESLYCNFTQGAGTSTDIQELDTIVRTSGQQRRVVFVADEGGQGDHLKVYLVAVTGAGSSTDGGSLALGAPAGSPIASPLQAQLDALNAQLGDIMTTLNANIQPRFLEINDPAATTSSAPFAIPPTRIDQYVIKRKITTATVDYTYTNNLPSGRQLQTTYANDTSSTASLTITFASGETFQSNDLGAGLTSFTLAPGESRTVVNISATIAQQI